MYKIPTEDVKRAFVWGMAIHNLADSFAHSTAVNGKRIKHNEKNNKIDADNINYYPQRWECAIKAVEQSILTYTNNQEGGLAEYHVVFKQNDFKMINIYNYVKEIYGETTAKYFKNKSENMNKQLAKQVVRKLLRNFGCAEKRAKIMNK